MLEKGEKIKLIAGVTLIGFVIISILSSQDSNIFQAQLGQELHKAPALIKCERIMVTSQPPSPFPPYTSALIRIQTIPINFPGLITFSTDSGIFNDFMGQNDSYIETNEKIVSFSGGEPGTTLTIQDREGDNFNCYSTLEVSNEKPIPCSSLQVKSSPSPLPQNQSAEIEIITNPEKFIGTYLIQAESGKLQPATADTKTTGINTNTLVTSSKFLIYSGGKTGEKINFQVLGENNNTCQATLTIE